MSADDVRRSSKQLTDTQRLAWLRLIRSDRIGPATFRELLDHFGSATAAIKVERRFRRNTNTMSTASTPPKIISNQTALNEASVTTVWSETTRTS